MLVEEDLADWGRTLWFDGSTVRWGKLPGNSGKITLGLQYFHDFGDVNDNDLVDNFKDDHNVYGWLAFGWSS